EVSIPVNVNTTPPGAKVLYRRYGDAGAPWRLAGQTPLDKVRMPAAYMHVRLEKEGFEPVELATVPGWNGQNIPLLHAGRIPAGMIPVAAQASWMMPVEGMPLPDYFLDKFEVTNSQFQKFLEAGGYHDPKYWRYPF